MKEEDVELIVLRTARAISERGTSWVDSRIALLENCKLAQQRANRVALIDPFLAGKKSLGEAVIAAIEYANMFVTCRQIVEILKNYPAIRDEQDIRIKRRKVSQALFAQKNKFLLCSVRKNDKGNFSTRWGLPSWVNLAKDGIHV